MMRSLDNQVMVNCEAEVLLCREAISCQGRNSTKPPYESPIKATAMSVRCACST